MEPHIQLEEGLIKTIDFFKSIILKNHDKYTGYRQHGSWETELPQALKQYKELKFVFYRLC